MINFPSSFLKTLLVNAFVLYCMNIMLWKGKPVDSSYVYSVYCLHSCVLRGVCRKRIIQSFFPFQNIIWMHYWDDKIVRLMTTLHCCSIWVKLSEEYFICIETTVYDLIGWRTYRFKKYFMSFYNKILEKIGRLA